MPLLRPIVFSCLLFSLEMACGNGKDEASRNPGAGGIGVAGEKAVTGGVADGSAIGGNPTAGGAGANTSTLGGSPTAAGVAGRFGGTSGAGGGSGIMGGSSGIMGGSAGTTGGSAGISGGTPGTAGRASASAGASGAVSSAGQANLPAGVTRLFPPPNGTDICPDPPLRIGFTAPPTLGTAAKIQVRSASGSVVATVDMAQSQVQDSIGGTTFDLLRPVYIDGNDVVIYLKTKALAYGQTYSVIVESGAVRAPGGGALAITGETSWKFTTKAAAPRDLAALSVALDGSGDFCSVQGAMDALPAKNSPPAVVTVQAGTYHEIIHVTGKSDITLRGDDRKRSIISGTNNEKQNPGTKTRSLVGFDDTTRLTIENLTIENLTPQGGSQAEALRLQGCDQCIVRAADIRSLQDTLLFRGRIYVKDSTITGNVDYIWGDGVAYFDGCEIRTVGRSGVIVQARNTVSAYGFVFVDSKLTADAAAPSNILARIDASVYPGSHVAYIDCEMSNVDPKGWTITGGSAPASLRFWEYQSHDPAGNAVSVSNRVAGSTRITSAQAAMMRDKATVLGGWNPN